MTPQGPGAAGGRGVGVGGMARLARGEALRAAVAGPEPGDRARGPGAARLTGVGEARGPPLT